MAELREGHTLVSTELQDCLQGAGSSQTGRRTDAWGRAAAQHGMPAPRPTADQLLGELVAVAMMRCTEANLLAMWVHDGVLSAPDGGAAGGLDTPRSLPSTAAMTSGPQAL